MTIQFTNLRTRGNEPPFPPIIIPRNIDKAFNALVSCELAFGCQIKDITPTRIETVTYVMSCVDTTIIEGTEEEMKLLVGVAILYPEIQGNKEKRYNDAVIDQVMKITQGIPLLVKLGGDTLSWNSGQPVQVPFCKLEELARDVAVATLAHERLTRQDKPVYPLIDFFNDLLTCDSWSLIQEKIEKATDLNELFMSNKEHPSHQHWLNLKAANDKGNLRLLVNEWLARIYTGQAQELRCILAVKGSQNG